LVTRLEKDRNAFFFNYLSGDTRFRRNAVKVMKTPDFIGLVKYAWENNLKCDWQIPEAVKASALEDCLGGGVFVRLGLNQGARNELLEMCLDG